MKMTLHRSLIDISITALALVVGAAAFGFAAAPATAQTPDAALAPPPPLPSYATGEESIRGRIAAITGKYALQVRDNRGFLDNVSLHDGTVINPTGLRLAPGQSVVVLGHNSGKTFEANEIDTPYAFRGGYPAYVYGPYPYAYPSFAIGIGTGPYRYRGWY